VALLDRRLADQVGHLGVDDPEHADRHLLGLHAELGPERGERAQRERAVEMHPPAEEEVRVEVAEHEVGIVTVGSVPPFP